MDKGQGSRNKEIIAKDFKGMQTVLDRSELGIDVAELAQNIVWDVDGGFRKREGVVSQRQNLYHNINFIDIKKVSPSEINIDHVDNDLIPDNGSPIIDGAGYDRNPGKYELNTFTGSFEDSRVFDPSISDISAQEIQARFLSSMYLTQDYGIQRELITVRMPRLIEVVGTTFMLAKKLVRAEMPNLIYIRHNAFDGSGIKVVDFPNVITVEKEAFGASEVTSINLPKVKEIGPSAFAHSRLTSLSLPNVETIGEGAFYTHEITNTFTTLSIPKVTKIGKNAFNNTKIKIISAPYLEEIGERAFDGRSTVVFLPRANKDKVGNMAIDVSGDPKTIVTLPDTFNNPTILDDKINGGWRACEFRFIDSNNKVTAGSFNGTTTFTPTKTGTFNPTTNVVTLN